MKINNSQEHTSRVYTVSEIAQILGISRTAAYALVKECPFQVMRIGSTIRIAKQSFDRWLEGVN